MARRLFARQASPIPYLVDSTHLRQRKTDTRNGITLKSALVGGRYDK
jgi:hypothetical protein